jgi:hypothetical protein
MPSPAFGASAVVVIDCSVMTRRAVRALSVASGFFKRGLRRSRLVGAAARRRSLRWPLAARIFGIGGRSAAARTTRRHLRAWRCTRPSQEEPARHHQRRPGYRRDAPRLSGPAHIPSAKGRSAPHHRAALLPSPAAGARNRPTILKPAVRQGISFKNV